MYSTFKNYHFQEEILKCLTCHFSTWPISYTIYPRKVIHFHSNFASSCQETWKQTAEKHTATVESSRVGLHKHNDTMLSHQRNGGVQFKRTARKIWSVFPFYWFCLNEKNYVRFVRSCLRSASFSFHWSWYDHWLRMIWSFVLHEM